MGKKVAILQSNYIPWKGYFDIINMVDEFIIFDDAQYTKNDWRNRNKIKTHNGIQWITIPILHNKLDQKIKDTKIATSDWNKKHWKTIKLNYSKATFFKQYEELFESIYLNSNNEYLSDINFNFISEICKILNIMTDISFSGNYHLVDGQTERLIYLCKQAGATEYLSGPSAKNYIDEDLFEQEKIKLSWMKYADYPEYKQLYDSFSHNVTILDLIFNTGNDIYKYMKSFNLN